MNKQIIYEERILSKGILLILGLITLIMLISLISQIVLGPIGSKPAPNSVYVILLIFFILLTFNFAFLKIKITDEAIQASYGIIYKTLKWSEIELCEKDSENLFYGYGIRFGKYKNRWVWIYNIMGGHRIALLTNNKSLKGLIVSTLKPDELIQICQNFISKQK